MENISGFMKRVLATNPSETYEREFAQFIFNNPNITPSQLFQDLFVLFTLAKKRNGFFVEVGVGSGIDHSNTFLLESEFNWNGLLIEPNPSVKRSIIRNRRAPLIQKAIGEKSGNITFNETTIPELSFVNDLPVDGLNREIKRKYVCEVQPLDNVLSENNVPKNFDYLSIDVEGAELDVLKGFTIDKWNPKVITIETNYSLDKENLIRNILSGYDLVFRNLSGCDLWFINSNI